MRSSIRFGIAAAAALAFTPSAKPCDPRAYDPKDDAPREQICPPEHEGRAAVPKDEQRRREAEAKRAQARAPAGSGGGEPRAREREAPADESLQKIWSAP